MLLHGMHESLSPTSADDVSLRTGMNSWRHACARVSCCTPSRSFGLVFMPERSDTVHSPGSRRASATRSGSGISAPSGLPLPAPLASSSALPLVSKSASVAETSPCSHRGAGSCGSSRRRRRRSSPPATTFPQRSSSTGKVGELVGDRVGPFATSNGAQAAASAAVTFSAASGSWSKRSSVPHPPCAELQTQILYCHAVMRAGPHTSSAGPDPWPSHGMPLKNDISCVGERVGVPVVGDADGLSVALLGAALGDEGDAVGASVVSTFPGP